MGELNHSLKIYTQRGPENVLSVLNNSVNHSVCVCGFSLCFLKTLTHMHIPLSREEKFIPHYISKQNGVGREGIEEMPLISF